jgi:hypothetical protein
VTERDKERTHKQLKIVRRRRSNEKQGKKKTQQMIEMQVDREWRLGDV